MKLNGYNVYYDNVTGRVIYNKKNNISIPNNRFIAQNNDNNFEKKMEELYKFANIDDPEKVNIERTKKISDEKKIETINIIKEALKKKNSKNQQKDDINELERNNTIDMDRIKINLDKKNSYENTQVSTNTRVDAHVDARVDARVDKSISIIKKDLVYGIKKTILSDFNYLNISSNNSDFKIGLNKNNNHKNDKYIFDCFYLFPNISEINTKNETNIVNEKHVSLFKNINNTNDEQFFPIDFIPCGVTIPLKTKNSLIRKIKITNIYWNIFQSIKDSKYTNNELLGIIPNKNDFIYENISLKINFELHSQVSKKLISMHNQHIVPYRDENIKNAHAPNSCLYNVISFNVNKLNGANFEDLEIDLIEELDIQCALLCIKISVPEESINILKGNDKNNSIFCGHIPFSQFILNLDYEVY
jgi:hypothetical protein